MNKAWPAMADPTRRGILALLRKGDLTAGEIAANFTISKPSISHHLNILKEAQLVSCQKQGQTLVYSINTTVFQDILSFIAEMSKEDKHEKTV